HWSRVESSGLGWPQWDPGRAPGQAYQVGAEKERVTVVQAADERAEGEPPTRVRQALSAAVSRETEDRAPDGAAGEGPGGGPPAGGARGAAGTAPRPAGGARHGARTAGGRGPPRWAMAGGGPVRPLGGGRPMQLPVRWPRRRPPARAGPR